MNQNFVKVNENILDIILDLRYASKNNFTKQKLYFSNFCYLHKVAFEHLSKSVEISKKLGLKIKIFDAYRPVIVQKNYGIFFLIKILLHHQQKGPPIQEGWQ